MFSFIGSRECDGCQAAEKASGEKAEKEKQNSERRAYKGSPATWLQRNHEFLQLFLAHIFALGQ